MTSYGRKSRGTPGGHLRCQKDAKGLNDDNVCK